MAGLAGVLEATTQSGQLNLGFPSGYGFTAIIVSFLGRLHPIGIVLAGIVLAISYVGGQVAQTTVHVPSATAGIFQAMMLFFILASDVLVRRRSASMGRRKTWRRGHEVVAAAVHCRPRERGDAAWPATCGAAWMPAFAGMTERLAP